MEQNLDAAAASEFKRRKLMVRWYSPRILGLTGLQVLLGHVFGAYADKREFEQVFSCDSFTEVRPAEDLWFDYVADLGDAYGPTSAIAGLIAADTLEVDGLSAADRPLAHGSFLVMGGDQVYPSPSSARYLNQTFGPYAEALPDGEPRSLYALPGNHDWYDGLTLFLRRFCQQRRFGAWETKQHRSYFAIRLSEHWWMCGVDVQLGGEVDDAQLQYFKHAPLDGANIVLCWAVPVWTKLRGKPDATKVLDSFEQDILSERHAKVRVFVAGDSHHFAHYVSDTGDEHRITAGGGGAFLSSTHNLQETISLPDRQLKLEEQRYPSKATSRLCSLRGLLVGWHNPSFLLLAAAVHVALAWAVQFGARAEGASFVTTLTALTPGRTWSGFVRNPVALLLAATVLAGWVAFVKPDRDRWKILVRWLVGLPHGLLHVGISLVATYAAAQACDPLVDGEGGGNWKRALFTLAFLLMVAVIGASASSLLVGVYLLFTNLFRMHDNELFSAFHHTGYKNFLRFRLRAEQLSIWPIGTDSTSDGKVAAKLIGTRIDIDPIPPPAEIAD